MAVYLGHIGVFRDRDRDDRLHETFLALYNGIIYFILYTCGAIHVYVVGVVERILLWGLLCLGLMVLVVRKSRPHSIHSIIIKSWERSARKMESVSLLIAILAVFVVAESCLASLTGFDWFYRPFSSKIDYEAVNRWKEDTVQILCLPLTALLISLLIMRIPYV